MYYLEILHRIPYTTIEYTDYEYFQDKESAKYYIDNIFKPGKYNPDSCLISGHGETMWSKNGHLITE